MSERYYATVSHLGRVELGPMLPSERAFVLHSWVHGLTDTQGYGVRSGSRHRSAYLAANGHRAERMLEQCDVLVARDAECAALAYGWMAAGPVDGVLALHWASTKAAYRRLGIARLLLDAMDQHAEPIRRYTQHSRHDVLAERLGLTYLATQRRAVSP